MPVVNSDGKESVVSTSGIAGLPTWETLQEATARLLFVAIKWVKCLGPFQSLALSDQVMSHQK